MPLFSDHSSHRSPPRATQASHLWRDKRREGENAAALREEWNRRFLHSGTGTGCGGVGRGGEGERCSTNYEAGPSPALHSERARVGWQSLLFGSSQGLGTQAKRWAPVDQRAIRRRHKSPLPHHPSFLMSLQTFRHQRPIRVRGRSGAAMAAGPRVEPYPVCCRDS